MPQIWKIRNLWGFMNKFVFASFSSNSDFTFVCALSFESWWDDWESFYSFFSDKSMRFSWIIVWLHVCIKVCSNRFEVLTLLQQFWNKKSIFWGRWSFLQDLHIFMLCFYSFRCQSYVLCYFFPSLFVGLRNVRAKLRVLESEIWV